MAGIRRGAASDFAEIAAIQERCPEAAQWDVTGYGEYELWVADGENRVAGFLLARSLGEGEFEVLNLAVAPEFRRLGLARALIEELTRSNPCTIFLEVRESNLAARKLYKSMGFKDINVRQSYYESPLEAAIVMKFHSC